MSQKILLNYNQLFLLIYSSKHVNIRYEPIRYTYQWRRNGGGYTGVHCTPLACHLYLPNKKKVEKIEKLFSKSIQKRAERFLKRVLREIFEDLQDSLLVTFTFEKQKDFFLAFLNLNFCALLKKLLTPLIQHKTQIMLNACLTVLPSSKDHSVRYLSYRQNYHYIVSGWMIAVVISVATFATNLGSSVLRFVFKTQIYMNVFDSFSFSAYHTYKLRISTYLSQAMTLILRYYT